MKKPIKYALPCAVIVILMAFLYGTKQENENITATLARQTDREEETKVPNDICDMAEKDHNEDGKSSNEDEEFIQSSESPEGSIAETRKGGAYEQMDIDTIMQSKDVTSILAKLNIRPEDIIEKKIVQTPPYGEHELDIWTDSAEFIFSLERKILRYYFETPAQLAEEAILNEMITEEKAISLATEFVEKFDITLPKYTAQCTDCSPLENRHSSTWRIEGHYMYQNVDIFCSQLSIWVSASDGKVYSVSYDPGHGYPESMVQNITKQEAIDKSQELMRKMCPREYTLKKSTLTIVCPNDFLQANGARFLKQSATPCLCWLNGFTHGSIDDVIWLYVSCETGNIIGGMRLN